VLACGNLWLPWAVKWQIKSKTGFTADIESSQGSLFKGYVDLRDLRISNPRDKFETNKFVYFNEFATDIKLGSLFTDTIVIEKIIVDVDNITLVKNAGGIYNCQLFTKSTVAPDPSNDEAKINGSENKSKKIAKEKVPKKVRLDKVLFTIKSVKIIDESVNCPANEIIINYRREFSNVDDPNKVIKTLLSDLSKYGLSLFIQTTFDSVLHLPGIEQITSGLIKTKDISKDIVSGIGNRLKDLFKKKPNKSSK
jgi:hypothetical protein